MRLPFCMWHKGSVLRCDFTIYMALAFTVSAGSVLSLFILSWALWAPQNCQKAVLHTHIFWVSIAHLLLKVKAHRRTRSWRISSKDSPMKKLKLSVRLLCSSWANEISLCVELLPCSNKAGIYLSDPQFWCLEKYLLGQFYNPLKIFLTVLLIRWFSDEISPFPKKEKEYNLRQKTN